MIFGGIQRSLLGFAAMHAPPWICRATVPAGLQPTHNHLLDVCFKVSSFKELIKMTVLQCTMMAPAAAMPDKTGMEDWTSSLGLTSQHVSATFYLSQLPGCSMLFYWVKWTDSSSYLELSWAVLVVALRSDCYFVARIITISTDSSLTARQAKIWLATTPDKKRLRTSQDYSGRMVSDLQGHSESFHVFLPLLWWKSKKSK